MSIIQFPKKKASIFEIKLRMDVEVLEDGSLWWRVENLKTRTYGEWIRYEEKE